MTVNILMDEADWNGYAWPTAARRRNIIQCDVEIGGTTFLPG